MSEEKEAQQENESIDKEILEHAKKRFKFAEESTSEIRKLALDDLSFRAGEQWPENIKMDRENDRRPCLTINRIPQFIRQITNDQRQNRPSIKVYPVDDKADIETAKIKQGLIRHIEYNSNADVAYDTAFDGSVTKGFGYFRVTTDYVSPTSFDQEILIKRIRNSFSVFLDPTSKEPDGSDANWGFIFEDMTKEDFENEYPDCQLSNMEDWGGLSFKVTDWVTEKMCRVAEYYYKDFEKKIIVQLNDGSVIEKSKLPKGFPKENIINEREALIPVIKWCKLNGIEILEKTDWLGQWIPIIPVYGDELDVDGKVILEGAIRHAKDSQRMYNYWASTETETISLAPRTPFIVAEGQIDGYKAAWSTANTKNHAYLTYKPTSFNGSTVGPPQRNSFEPAVQAITNARLQAAEDMKATTGIYDASMGARSNETSGVAIRGRQAQSQTSNFHFIDNLNRSIRHAGRIVLDLIPKIYDSARAARIIGEDGEHQVVLLNQIFNKNGQNVQYNMGSGKYDIVVETGPSYATKRQEALASMIDLTRSYPQVAQVAGDLMVKNMDWPGAQEIAERLKKTMPPNLTQENGQGQLPPEAQAQIAQMQQTIQMLDGQLAEAQQKLQLKAMELDSRERIEFAKMDVDLTKKAAELDSREAIVMLQQQISDIENYLAQSQAPQNQNFNGYGPQGAVYPQDNQQQPTDGYSSGQPMGV